MRSLFVYLFLSGASTLVYGQQASVKQLLSSYDNLPDSIAINKLDSLATVYRSTDIATTKIVIAKAYELAEGISDRKYLAQIHNSNAISQYFQSDLDSALYFFQESIDAYRTVGDQLMVARLHNNMGIILESQGLYDKAIEQFINSLEIKDELKDYLGAAKSKYNIANVWIELGDYDKAKEINEELLNEFQEHGTESDIIDVKQSLAVIASNQGDLSRSLRLDKEVLDYHLANGDDYSSMMIYGNIGQTYYKLEKFDSSLIFLEKSLGIANQINSLDHIASAKRSLGDAYSAQGDNIRAINYISESVELFDSLGYQDELSDSYQFLYEAQEKAGRYEDAYDNLHNYMVIKDSIASKQMQTDLAEMETKYETEKKEAQIILLEKEAELDDSRKKALLGGIGLLALLGGGVSYGQYQKRKRELEVAEKEKELEVHKRKVAEEELELKKKELTAKALQLASKNEFLQSLEEEVTQLSSSIDDSVNKATARITRMIRSDSDDEAEWRQFSKEFSSIHQEFVDRLVDRYGSFTQSEMRLVSLLKMNLTSKEIANILRVSDEGIKKARYRLRKKMGLESKQDLGEVILSI